MEEGKRLPLFGIEDEEKASPDLKRRRVRKLAKKDERLGAKVCG
jgi:hypothetical protein